VIAPRAAVRPVAAAPPRERAAAWTVVASGLAVLVLRVVIGVATAAPIFLVIGVASIAPPIARDRRRLPTPAVLGIGAVAVLTAALAAAPVLPAPFGVGIVPVLAGGAVAEELLFRRLLYGLLAPHGAAVAILVTAGAFALIHLPLYGSPALPVDFGAGLLLSWQRWASGNWGASAATHAFANLLVVIR
jgi:membrane protease YdiL (CAAX protease family)